jgi:hypothetical protein
VSGPSAPPTAAQTKTGISYAPLVEKRVQLKKVTLKTNSEFAHFLAEEMEARGIEVPKKTDGNPHMGNAKKAFTQWLIKNDPGAKSDKGKSFKPVFPEKWTELLPTVPVNEAADAEFDDDDSN